MWKKPPPPVTTRCELPASSPGTVVISPLVREYDEGATLPLTDQTQERLFPMKLMVQNVFLKPFKRFSQAFKHKNQGASWLTSHW